MSVIQFVSSGGVAIVGGDLSETDQQEIKSIVTLFGEKVDAYAHTLQALSPYLVVQKCNHLFVGKDASHYHFVFVNDFGGTSVNYRDLGTNERVELKNIVAQIRQDGGKVVWAFSCPSNITLTENEVYIHEGVVEYVGNILKADNTPHIDVSSPMTEPAAIESAVEKFYNDCPKGMKTAFIMQVGQTKLHADIVTTIKQILDRHNIIGLRAGDRKYRDDDYQNAQTYMHATDFGIGLFDTLVGNDINPDVTLGVGYMLGRGKQVMLLKDKNIIPSSTDLNANHYKNFDPENISATLPNQIEQWLADHGLS